ncbi:retrotransposon protein, putative, ty1-copia subclass [Tanacetum coccineum]
MHKKVSGTLSLGLVLVNGVVLSHLRAPNLVSTVNIEDLNEYQAIIRCFGESSQQKINSTKSMLGHLVGASGAVETRLSSQLSKWHHPSRMVIDAENIEHGDNCGFNGWFDPPMCPRAAVIIPGLLRNINELREIADANAIKARRMKTSRVSKPPQDPQFYYGFHIEEDKISDSTLSELDEHSNYKEAMASPEAAKCDVKLLSFTETDSGCVYGTTRSLKIAKYPKRECKLQRLFKGLKQASRSWNLCFHEKVTQFGFSRSEDESCIYVKISGSIDLGDAANILVIFVRKHDELDKMSRVPYASAIGSIMYAMTCTRPDVSFDLSMVSRHQQNPGEGHWTAVKNILKYLRNTKDRFLVYGGEKELRVTGYSDAGWQTDKDDSRSQSGWIFLQNGGAASKEAIWMKNFIGDLGVVPTVQNPIEIFCDNESAVALTKEPKDHGKSKHIDRKYHFVRSKVEEGHVIVK